MSNDNPILDLVAGARPNFVKLAPVMRACVAVGGLRPRIIHTGQHYDRGMNDVFFEELGIPEPEVHLEVGSAPHGAQTARILEGYEKHLIGERPDLTVVFGDVNSTVGCALAAVKLGVSVAHVEAGLRSFDRTMPEEINRILTDAMADLLLVSEPSGVENLRREGVENRKVKLVGNVMIDTLRAEMSAAQSLKMAGRFGLAPRGYGLVTLHRPSNVDDPRTLARLLGLLGELSAMLPLVFTMHPRTRGAVRKERLEPLLSEFPRLVCIDPLAYRENLGLMAEARLVLTDSGGIQEETTALKVPCLTLRDNTERPVTVELGTGRLVGNDPERIRSAFDDVLSGRWPQGQDVPLWDGKAGSRIADCLKDFLAEKLGREPVPCLAAAVRLQCSPTGAPTSTVID